MEAEEGPAMDPMFDPAVFVASNPRPDKKDFLLEEDELRLWAIKATDIRDRM